MGSPLKASPADHPQRRTSLRALRAYRTALAERMEKMRPHITIRRRRANLFAWQQLHEASRVTLV